MHVDVYVLFVNFLRRRLRAYLQKLWNYSALLFDMKPVF